jgi:hypothetical protein
MFSADEKWFSNMKTGINLSASCKPIAGVLLVVVMRNCEETELCHDGTDCGIQFDEIEF